MKSKSYEGQVNEVLCKVIAHNLCCLVSAMYELGLEMLQFRQPAPLVVDKRLTLGKTAAAPT